MSSACVFGLTFESIIVAGIVPAHHKVKAGPVVYKTNYYLELEEQMERRELFYKPKTDPTKMNTPQATEVINFKENQVVKEDEPLKTAADEISSTASINETLDICSEVKMTEVIESDPEDNNENDTPIPDNNENNTSIPDKNENDTPIPETALPYKPA